MIPFSASWPQEIVRALLALDDQRLLEAGDALQASVVLELDRREWSLLKREFHYGGVMSQVAVAGNRSAVGVRVPANVDEVCVIYFVKNTGGSPADLILGNLGTTSIVAGEQAATPATAALDSRIQKSPTGGGAATVSAALMWRAFSVGGIGVATYTLHESLADGERLTHGQHGYLAVLGPKGFLGLQAQGVNLAAAGNFWFYERPTRGEGRYFV